MSLAAFFKSRTGRRLLLVFRWGRISVLLVIFLLVAAVAYLHLIGLPDFLKLALFNHLHGRGFELQFTSARLEWGPEVLVDNAAFHRADRPLGPRLAAGQARIRLNSAKLLQRRVSVDSLLISQGSLQLPFSEARGDSLFVNDVFLDLTLLPDDTVRLNSGRAAFRGIQINLRGTVTNFLAARKVNLWPGGDRTNLGPVTAPQDSLRQIAATMDKIHFQAPPRLDLDLTADGGDPDTLRIALKLQSDGVQTPWGEATGLKLDADCARPVHSGDAPFVTARLSAAAFATPEARGRNLYLTNEVFRVAGSNFQAAVQFAVSDFAGRPPGSAESNQLETASLRWDGSLTLRANPPALLAASGNLQAAQPVMRWGSAGSAAITFNAAPAEGSPDAGDSWGFWAKINHWAVDWQADLKRVTTPDAQLDRFLCAGSWRAPELVLTNLEAALYGGRFSGRARLDAASRELQTSARFNFDLHALSHLIPASARTWLDDFHSERPPDTMFEARLVLPPWINPPPDWAARLLPSLQLAGDFAVGSSSFRGFSLLSAQSRFAWSNQILDVSRLHLVRPGGDAWVDFTENGDTGGFAVSLDSQLNPADFRPLLPEEQQPFLDRASFPDAFPPAIHAQIRGRWNQPDALSLNARLNATNFSVLTWPPDDPGTDVAAGTNPPQSAHLRETVDGLDAAIEYTNSIFRLRNLRLFKDGGELKAAAVGLDWKTQRVSFSNVVSTLDKNLIVRGLGPIAPPWLKVIGFDTPPTARLDGSFSLDDSTPTDLHFDVSGRNFRYSRLQAATASGRVNWTGKSVAVTNLQAGLYDGTLLGWGVFDYSPPSGTLFRGQVSLAKIELAQVVKGWSDKPSRIEGELDGQISIPSGNCSTLKSWTGSGRLSVNHALLWDIRLFGIFSPLLNKIVPGSGDSRAYQATADFIVTNGMVATDNLEIRSTDFRLLYRGTLNTERELDATVEAKVLRDTPLIGRLVSFLLKPLSKLFEYKIGGTLDEPKRSPLFVHDALKLIAEPFQESSPPPRTPSPATPNPDH